MVEHCQFLRVGELAAIVGDDTARGPGTGEYSGLWSLVHDSCPAGAFQAAYAGLIASAHRGTGPTLERLDENAARLVRGPCDRNPHATVSGTYRLAAPHYVDYTYDVEFTADADALPRCIRHSWCSYVNSPLDPSIHFIENNVWTSLTPVVHGDGATVLPTGLDLAHRSEWEMRTGEARFSDQEHFANSFSGKTFDYPFYFGKLHGLIYLLMVDVHHDFRIFLSPSGAGYSAVPGLASPAWDFEWVIWDPKPGQTRRLNVRLALMAASAFKLPQQVWSEWETFRSIHELR